MKILVSSHRFAPDIGGIETVGRLLCQEFIAAGHEVCVLTETPSPNGHDRYQIVRQPAPGDVLKWIRWADVVFHNNISLRHAWPLTVVRRPWVAAVHTWVARPEGTRDFRDRMKLTALSRADVISVSSHIANSLPFPSTVVPDPYDTEVFRMSDTSRQNDIVFVGRLVSDKGVDLLVRAIAQLRDAGITVQTRIIGEGPESSALKELARHLGVAGQVEFTGAMQPLELAAELCSSRMLVVPSRWSEPFGIVALEGLACGCAVVAADGGGLVEAIGNCGLLFRRGDADHLAEQIRRVMEGKYPAPEQTALQHHLKRHSPGKVAAEYLRIFGAAIGASRS